MDAQSGLQRLQDQFQASNPANDQSAACIRHRIDPTMLRPTFPHTQDPKVKCMVLYLGW